MNAVLDEQSLLSSIRARRNGATVLASARELDKRVCPVVKDQGKAMKVGIFAGVHGDEPSGVKAALMLHRWALTLPKELSGYEMHLFPSCNPSGLNDGTRHTGMGYDINREFWCGSDLPEVRYLESELRSERYDVIVSLHEDDTSHGLYGFVSGSLLSEQVLKPALIAASRYLPLNLDQRIDGFSASGGVITEGYPGVLSAPPEQRPRALEIVFETPGRASVKLQAVAAAVAVKTMLVEYRKFLAYADNL